MKKTRVSQILGIEYPILQGGMLWLADAGLAAAVSNAGGLGVISPMAGMEAHGEPVDNLKDQIEKAKGLTENPFGVNIPIDLRDCGLLMDLILTQEVQVVVTAAGDPRLYTELLQSQDTKVLHVLSSVRHAKAAESAGVDAIIVEGVEAAARNGFDELPLFSLIPQVVDAVSIPVIAAGGIVDSRGVVAAMALGAEAVQLGTRLVVVKESIASQGWPRRSALDRDDHLPPVDSIQKPQDNRIYPSPPGAGRRGSYGRRTQGLHWFCRFQDWRPGRGSGKR